MKGNKRRKQCKLSLPRTSLPPFAISTIEKMFKGIGEDIKTQAVSLEIEPSNEKAGITRI